MRVEMCRAIGDGIRQPHVPLKPLVQIPGLRNVDGDPIAIRQKFGVDVKTWQRSEGGVQGMDFVTILRPGLSGPEVGVASPLGVGMTTE